MNPSALHAESGHARSPWRSFLACTGLALGLLLSLACGGGKSSPPPPPPPIVDIAEALRTTPGISGVTETITTIPGTRFFHLRLTQPVDHNAPGGATFQQFLTLLYRSRTAPVVLATTGYAIGTGSRQGEPTRLLNANQITLEHRFFATSTPSPTDWSKLSIQQAAADQHRVVTTLKPLFSGRWLNTGGSKGGMTALFHRRFYPNDVDVTLAYVAPISLSTSDTRYPPFVDSRGDSATRAALEAWQQAILAKRSEVLALFQADAVALGETFNLLGADRCLEFAVLESPFILWQYGNASLAAQVPPADASAQALYDYLNQVNGGVVSSWCDTTLTYYQAYYQQAANQLGAPALKESHLTGLNYPGQNLPAIYPPLGASKAHDGGTAMQDIQTWMNTTAQRVILVYGENDPWTAGALSVPSPAQAPTLRKYTAPGGNHGASLAALESAHNTEACALLSQWMGVPITPSTAPISAAKQSPAIDWMDTFVLRKPLR